MLGVAEDVLLTCAECGADNPAGTEFCEVCGTPMLQRGKARTAMAPPPDAARKSRTLYDPGPAKPEPSPSDVFTQSAPRRAGFDPSDPFKSSIVSNAPAVAPPRPSPAAPGPVATPRRQKTVLQAETPVQRDLGAVLCVHGASLQLVPLFGGRTAIGRDESADVVLDDPNVSGNHGFLFLKGDGASYIDVSRNGSIVDGAALMGDTAALRHGSVLQLGETRCVLLLVPNDAAPSS